MDRRRFSRGVGVFCVRGGWGIYGANRLPVPRGALEPGSGQNGSRPVLGVLEEVTHEEEGIVASLPPVIRLEGDALVVETDPGADNGVRVHADKPTIGVVLRRSRFPASSPLMPNRDRIRPPVPSLTALWSMRTIVYEVCSLSTRSGSEGKVAIRSPLRSEMLVMLVTLRWTPISASVA